MAEKVRYGLRNTKYALVTGTDANGYPTYGPLKDFPGAVSMTMTKEGGDSVDKYGDDGVYFTFAGTNGGYSADLTMVKVLDEIRRDLLGEIIDEGTGVQFETTDAVFPQFALITEMQGDKAPIGFVFYNCKASRIEMEANTLTDSPTTDDEKVSIRIAGQKLPFKGKAKGFVQGHIEKSEAGEEKFEDFFDHIVLPPAVAYEATVADATNGTVSLNGTSFAKGETVKVTATPADGYAVASVSYATEGGTPQTVEAVDGEYSFKMPEGAVTVTVTFASE